MKLYLFTTSTCSKCMAIEEFMDDNDIIYTSMVIDENENARTKATEFGVYSVPTIVREYDDGETQILTLSELKNEIN